MIDEAKVLYRAATEGERFLPEGPYQYGKDSVCWVSIQLGSDSTIGQLNILHWSTRTVVAKACKGRVGFAFPTTREGTFVLGVERDLQLFDFATGATSTLASEVDSDRSGTIINDGVIWKDNIIFGTKDLEFKTRKAGLYLFRGVDRKLFRLRDDQICSNGKVVVNIDSSRAHLFDIDSPTKTVVRYEIDVSRPTLSEPQVVIDLTSDTSVPDGMVMTPDGKSLIVSMYNPNAADFGETRQFSIDTGTLERIWRTPLSPQNTCPQIVAIDGKTYLVITTAVEHMPKDRQIAATNAGSLFFAELEYDAGLVMSEEFAPRFKIAV